MESNSEIVAFYRMAEKKNKYNKQKPEYINNANCFKNFKENFNGRLVVCGDRLEESGELVAEEEYHEIKNYGNAQSFREVMELALDLKNDQIVYFVEDDYLHKPNFDIIIQEGLDKVDFVSLYDHPDKYNGNPVTLFYTKSTHWQLQASTTMTFATKVSTLKQTSEVFYKYTDGDHPFDYFIFIELAKMYKRLATPIPGYATHGEAQWLSPITEWKKLAHL